MLQKTSGSLTYLTLPICNLFIHAMNEVILYLLSALVAIYYLYIMIVFVR